MGIVSFLKLGLKCFFDFLAWPLFALVCPLYASVWAIESNSNSDMRNLVAYWIVFSLISLFELAFVKLIEWLPFWPYMKLMAICWLGIPNFNGAFYVYECLIRSCLSVNLQGVIKRFVKHKDDLPLNAESFLAVAERYVKENGSEELEKLIDRSRHMKPNFDEEEIKVVTNTEEKETATAIQTFKEPNVAKEDAKAVDPKEKILSDSTQWSKLEESYVANENAKAGELNEKNPAAATEQVNCVEPNLIQTEKKTVATSEIIEKTVTQDVRENKAVEVPAAAIGGGENKVTEIPASENVQREWTACQLTTMCEKNFQSLLQGRKHKAQFAAEEKEIQTFKEPNVAKEDAKAVDPKEKILSDSTQWFKFEEPYVANKNAKAGELNEKNPAAATEQVNCVELNLIQTEKKTVAASEIIEKMVTQDVRENKVVKVPAPAAGGGENKVTEMPASEYVQREWTACQLTTMCEKNFQSHLQGRKHKAEFAAEDKEIQVKCVVEPNLAQTEKKMVAARGIKEQGKCVEDPNLAQTAKKTVASIEIKGKTVTAAVRENKIVEVPAVTSGGGGNKDVERPALENVQKEWTCAICQVTTSCEANLMSHLYGRKHRATCAELQASKQANKNKGCSSSTVNQEQPKKPNNQNKSKKQEDKVQVNWTSEQYRQKEVKNTTGYGVNNNSQLWCIICNVKCHSEVDVASHLKGKRHLSQVQQMLDSVGGWH
ncbi:uncharacterized abhydrolase domain-containing protein DDB_G0269086-like [Camellia sinensis]|uniref:uncharacterized abhydrolase domain-containing protein DDB_G0269086-like n=1 Tax=Camellia sinensis TaxID=4442 RepID=UPI001036C939|nr:uncharacterized abhydrolase domain-containing protein DDB_G0269086-like [Camellia sinensis]